MFTIRCEVLLGQRLVHRVYCATFSGHSKGMLTNRWKSIGIGCYSNIKNGGLEYAGDENFNVLEMQRL